MSMPGMAMIVRMAGVVVAVIRTVFMIVVVVVPGHDPILLGSKVERPSVVGPFEF
jgi:hypothetical protein